jgi:hypothetical protein
MAITLARRFRGPDRSGNGGYTSGLLAATVGAETVTVTLRKPPPLEVALEVRDGTLSHGDDVVAVAAPGELTRPTPEPVPYDVAAAASKSYAGFVEHPFPGCFTCGPERPDGLRIFPGRVSDDVVAAPWVPTEVAPEIVWAALDCPGGWAFDLVGRPMVLGRITATVLALPATGDQCVVVGQAHGTDGRKGFTSSALYAPDGALIARAEHTWIAVDPATINALR